MLAAQSADDGNLGVVLDPFGQQGPVQLLNPHLSGGAIRFRIVLAPRLQASAQQLDPERVEHLTDQTHLLIAATSERGLCGGFNANIAREARQRIRALEADGGLLAAPTDYASLLARKGAEPDAELVARPMVARGDADAAVLVSHPLFRDEIASRYVRS